MALVMDMEAMEVRSPSVGALVVGGLILLLTLLVQDTSRPEKEHEHILRIVLNFNLNFPLLGISNSCI